MFANTHKAIAFLIYDVLLKEYGIELNKQTLRCGAVVPDLHPVLMMMPHTKSGSIGYVGEMVSKIVSYGLPSDGKENERFSYNLGIVIHFISDYFCRAHNEKRFKNIMRHCIYENRLKKHFNKRLKRGNVRREFRLAINGITDLKGFLDNIHREYLLKRSSMSKDFVYSIEVSLTVATHIVDLCRERRGSNLLCITA